MENNPDIRQLRTSKKKRTGFAERRTPVILACDTSTDVGSVALIEGGAVTAETLVCSRMSHSLRILKDVTAMLSERGLKMQEIDAFACTGGPGSFTGVRIAMSTLKGLAWSTKKPLITVGSLDVLARPVLGRGMPVMAALDAKRHEVYGALFDHDGNVLIPQAAIAPAELAARCVALVGTGTPVIAVGEGIEAYAGLFEESLGSSIRRCSPWESYIRASVLGVIAAGKLETGEFSDVETVEPVYLRRSEAEINLDRKLEEAAKKGC